jgi:hypothetical protein
VAETPRNLVVRQHLPSPLPRAHAGPVNIDQTAEDRARPPGGSRAGSGAIPGPVLASRGGAAQREAAARQWARDEARRRIQSHAVEPLPEALASALLAIAQTDAPGAAG